MYQKIFNCTMNFYRCDWTNASDLIDFLNGVDCFWTDGVYYQEPDCIVSIDNFFKKAIELQESGSLQNNLLDIEIWENQQERSQEIFLTFDKERAWLTIKEKNCKFSWVDFIVD